MATIEKFETRIDLPAGTREKITALLNRQLADTFDLYSQTKQAHWNVKGEEFFQLHQLYDTLAAELLEDIDLIAERVTALGGTALGTIHMAAQASRLPEYAPEVIESLSSIEVLAVRYASLVETTRNAIDTATDEGDLSTADLLTQISRGLDKALWFLEAHLQQK